ncbi:MAG TPA: GNAT family N-acetyltransferase [Acidobacteriota bacterium]|nr:GNAT family N-acetyltransferase [Acidobacteriota bacterium]
MATSHRIVDLVGHDRSMISRLGPLVFEALKQHSPNWLPTVNDATLEILESLTPGRLSRVLIDSTGEPVGWIGTIPHNNGRVWEIHPIAVATAHQGRGYGRVLIEDLEKHAREQGVLTLWAGTSDETGLTNLSDADLYADPAAAIAGIKSRKPHAWEFWARVGFTVVGLMPDAEGRGKPSITMAKRVG